MTNETDEAVETATEAETLSLDDISQEFSVEEQVSNFQASPEQAQPSPTWLPDPISDPDAYTEYSRAQAESLNKLNQTVQGLTSKVQTYEQQLAAQKLSADVESAVATVNEKLGVDPKLAEIALEHQYRDDPAFKRIWDNRAQNPAAFKKALGVVANKLSDTFAVKQDHQLTQNQLAAKQSLKTMAKTSQPNANSEWEGLSSSEFEQKWNEMRRG